jgi:hypothetical protein
MFLDARNQKREGKCVSFIKLGPAAGRAGQGHLFRMEGFLCKAPASSKRHQSGQIGAEWLGSVSTQ